VSDVEGCLSGFISSGGVAASHALLAKGNGSRGRTVRIIGGKYGSRRLENLRGLALRPTSDRLRETLFNILGPAVEGSLFVDVYAGTGAVGIEALSRGASEAIFIEKRSAALALIRRNLGRLGIDRGFQILAQDAFEGLGLLASAAFGRRLQADFFFLDPPYAAPGEYDRVLQFLDCSKLLARHARVIVEHARRRALPERLTRLERTRVVEQGDATLSFYRLAVAA